MNKRLVGLDVDDLECDLGVIHYEGITACMTETLCGRVDTSAKWERTAEAADCTTCLQAEKELKKRWGFKK